jgi:tRNA-dihydrouridine synthase B
MRIGPYTLSNNLVLAPMAGITDRPFRQLCKELGAGMAVSEMVSSNSLLWGSDKTKRRANHEGEIEPRSVQIMGADPKLAGSALLRDEVLVGQILDAVVSAVPEVPVTLKIRTGWDHGSRNGVTIGGIAENAGIQALAVHGRTRADGYRGDAEYDTIAEIKSALTIPVIANGDITTPEKAKLVLDATGVDAVMIGRAAQGRPWIFREIAHYLETGGKLPEPGLEEVRDILLGHLDNLYDFYGEYTGVRMARKHISWYSKGQAHGGAFRQAVNHVDSAEEQLIMTKEFFARLIDTQERAA